MLITALWRTRGKPVLALPLRNALNVGRSRAFHQKCPETFYRHCNMIIYVLFQPGRLITVRVDS
jgi:hypothetical protein